MKTVLVENPTCCCGTACSPVRFAVIPLSNGPGTYCGGGYGIVGFQLVYCCDTWPAICASHTADTNHYHTEELPGMVWGTGSYGVNYSACLEQYGTDNTTIQYNNTSMTLPSRILVTFTAAGASNSHGHYSCCQYVLDIFVEWITEDPMTGNPIDPPVLNSVSWPWEPCDGNGNWNKAYSDDHDYIPHSCCFVDPIEPEIYTNFGCRSNDERCDPVEESAAAMMSLSSLPTALSSTSTASTTCRFATPTDRPWLGNVCNCRVVECRCPAGLADVASYGEHMQTRVRYPADTNGAAINDAGYYEVRSGYCGARYCLLCDTNV